MPSASVESVTDQVIQRARRQGFVVAREIREALLAAGLEAELWQEVVLLAGPALRLEAGRYHHTSPVTERARAARSLQDAVQEAIQELVREHREAARRVERRGEGRVEFVHPVTVVAEDGREFTLLSRDLSTTGIRLVGTRRLLGQKVRVLIPAPDDAPPWEFQVRILWTCPVGEDLVENGGNFLSVNR